MKNYLGLVSHLVIFGNDFFLNDTVLFFGYNRVDTSILMSESRSDVYK